MDKIKKYREYIIESYKDTSNSFKKLITNGDDKLYSYSENPIISNDLDNFSDGEYKKIVNFIIDKILINIPKINGDII